MRTLTPSLSAEIARGIVGGVSNICGFVILGAGFAWLASGVAGIGMDSTDKSAWNRSGFTVMADHATGLEYLKAGDALTPRLDGDGRQMREGE